MEKSIVLAGRRVQYTLRLSPRSVRLRLSIYHDGRFIVTAPPRVGGKTIEAFIVQKARWVLRSIDRAASTGVALLPKSTRAEYLARKNDALSLVHVKLAYFNEVYKFSYRKVTIRNQKTRWGSCSKKGNLSFNYKVVALPEKLADYLVVHELCHTQQLNHSTKFWELVARAVPNYRELRKQLRKFSAGYA